MKRNVKLLIVCLSVLSINGCGTDTIFTGCVTPDVEEPRYSNKQYNNILDNSKQCLTNFLIAKQHIEKLKKANEVCK